MAEFGRHPWFSTLLLLAGLVFAAIAGWAIWGERELQRISRQLVAQHRGFEALMRSDPAPTREVQGLIAADLARASADLARLQLAWKNPGPVSAAPEDGQAAFFDLVNYRQRLTKLAKERGVTLGRDESFGFKDALHAGPELPAIAAVHRRRVILESVLSELLEQQPSALLAVDLSADDGSRSGPSQPRLRHAGAAAIVERQFASIRFSGSSEVLRVWLNEIVASRLPVVVSEVSVVPVESAIVPRAHPDKGLVLSGEGVFAPITRPTVSEFQVRLDLVSLRPFFTAGGDS